MSTSTRQIKYGISSKNQGSFSQITGKSPKPKAMGAPRLIGTVVTLVFAALITHTTLLYLLPFANPKQILGITQQNYAAASMEGSTSSWIQNTFFRPFELRRTFLGTKQGIRAHYVVPQGTVVDLRVEHCARAFIIEAYHCKVIGISTSEINPGLGSLRFSFNRVGFYQFKDQLRDTDTGAIVPKSERDGYRIIWVRD